MLQFITLATVLASCSLHLHPPAVNLRIVPKQGSRAVRGLESLGCFFVRDIYTGAPNTLSPDQVRGRDLACLTLTSSLSKTYSQAEMTTGVPLTLTQGQHTLEIYGMIAPLGACNASEVATVWQLGDPKVFKIGSFDGAVAAGSTVEIVSAFVDGTTPDVVAPCAPTTYQPPARYVYTGSAGMDSSVSWTNPTLASVPLIDDRLQSMDAAAFVLPFVYTYDQEVFYRAQTDFLFEAESSVGQLPTVDLTLRVSGKAGGGCLLDALTNANFEVGIFNVMLNLWEHTSTAIGDTVTLNLSGPPAYYARSFNGLTGQYVHASIRNKQKSTAQNCSTMDFSSVTLSIAVP